MPRNALPQQRHVFRYPGSVRGVFGDLGAWFLFFFTIYVILLLKALTASSITDNILFGTYSILITVYILSRFLLAYFQRSLPYDKNYEPSVTFVVPAKNEEDNIAQTIWRFAEVNYPHEKIEVIAINDGSTDGTLEKMLEVERLIEPFIKRVEVIDWKKNRGKRHGMAEGVKRALNEIVIFIDSDSFIEPDCVKHLVKYFSNRAVGAVSGHTDVYNRETNLLTQMQSVRYYISFAVYKAAESVFGMVTCCPGCCSAYRRAYIMPVIEEWLHQKFLGTECTFGDDRSLTNFVIRRWKAVYSPEAKAHTVVPDTFKKYLRQQQRWKKSWVRETFIASSFVWRKNPIAALSFYCYVFLAFVSPIVFFRAVLWLPLSTRALPIAYLFGLFCMLLLHGAYYRLKAGPRAWIMAVLYFWINTVVLIWQLPWAIFTLNDSRWGTR
ncbi:MAG: glycosyltransferase [bacterium]|nr:glycosyltransferase [bacterium]